MIVRIVKMTFQQGKTADFERLFSEVHPVISGFPGCRQVRLLRQHDDPNVYFTYSEWDSEEALNHYRFSEFFKETWTKTKSLFSAKAQAWSLVQTGTPG